MHLLSLVYTFLGFFLDFLARWRFQRCPGDQQERQCHQYAWIRRRWAAACARPRSAVPSPWDLSHTPFLIVTALFQTSRNCSALPTCTRSSPLSSLTSNFHLAEFVMTFFIYFNSSYWLRLSSTSVKLSMAAPMQLAAFGVDDVCKFLHSLEIIPLKHRDALCLQAREKHIDGVKLKQCATLSRCQDFFSISVVHNQAIAEAIKAWVPSTASPVIPAGSVISGHPIAMWTVADVCNFLQSLEEIPSKFRDAVCLQAREKKIDGVIFKQCSNLSRCQDFFTTSVVHNMTIMGHVNRV